MRAPGYPCRRLVPPIPGRWGAPGGPLQAGRQLRHSAASAAETSAGAAPDPDVTSPTRTSRIGPAHVHPLRRQPTRRRRRPPSPPAAPPRPAPSGGGGRLVRSPGRGGRADRSRPPCGPPLRRAPRQALDGAVRPSSAENPGRAGTPAPGMPGCRLW